jgi:hypothetical protein
MVFNYIWTGKHPFEGQYENALMLTVEIRGGARPLLSERMPVGDDRTSIFGPFLPFSYGYDLWYAVAWLPAVTAVQPRPIAAHRQRFEDVLSGTQADLLYLDKGSGS